MNIPICRSMPRHLKILPERHAYRHWNMHSSDFEAQSCKRETRRMRIFVSPIFPALIERLQEP
jgi:hypothetical protein